MAKARAPRPAEVADGPQPLRQIRFPRAVTPSRELHERPELCLLPVASLVVDPRYQRAIGARGVSNIRRILERFDWRKFQPVVVAKLEDGRFAIIDGQHRATAALLHPGIDLVPCMIVKATVEEAAECFSAINGCVTAITPIHLFHARVAAGDAQALAVNEACAAAGCRILRYVLSRSKHKPGDTLSVGAVESCFKLHGRELLVLALRTLRATRDGKASLVVAPLLYAMCNVLSRNPVWRKAGHLVEVVRQANLEPVLDAAPGKARREQTSQSVVIESAIERALGKALGPGVPGRKEKAA